MPWQQKLTPRLSITLIGKENYCEIKDISLPQPSELWQVLSAVTDGSNCLGDQAQKIASSEP